MQASHLPMIYSPQSVDRLDAPGPAAARRPGVPAAIVLISSTERGRL